ncbi:MAG: Oligopeptide-binding protein OppA precursor [Planctomycetes bacterium ADurb.Bin126]|nr:MAG: Oligopeptide-binding protein OppA precursor [Planctomycetes bacterium ADurb.Bin126]HOD81860.1 ABC transporter substrate-binding protein [Phycisphaerae bacterium]HQL75756.1 ABC transporter substrate-binding protein [Phycisphaerae bacterium]
MKVFYLLAVVVVIALALSPFLGLLPEPKPVVQGEEIAAYDTLPAEVKSIDPVTAGDTTSAAIQGAIYESLYTYHYLVRPVMLAPQLADGWPTESQDRLTYTFKIRPDIFYQPNECFGLYPGGKPRSRTVKAEDFVLAFKRVCDFHVDTQLALAFIEDKIVGVAEYRAQTRKYAAGDFSRYDLPLEGVKAIDEHTLQIKLTSPWPQLLYVLAVNCYSPVPRELIDYHFSTRPAGEGKREPIPIRERPTEIHVVEHAVGTGPYCLEKFDGNNLIILRRNPQFRKETYPEPPDPKTLTASQKQSVERDKAAGLYDDAGKIIPFIDVHHLKVTKEMNPMWSMFMAKQVDRAAIPQEIYSQVVTPHKDLAERWIERGIRLQKYSYPALYWLAFNMDDRVLGKSKSLRQALNLCFNVERYVEVLYNGRGMRAVNYVPSDFEAYSEAGPSPYARYDVQAAKEKAEQARKELVAAGVIQPGEDIPELTVDFGGRDEDHRRMGDFAQQQFKQIGIRLKIELNDWPSLQQKVNKKQVQMYSMGWHADYPDPENFLQLYYTPNIKRGTNNTNYSNAEFDKLYEQIAVMLPSPERTALYVKMIRMLNEDCPVLLLTEPVGYVLSHPWMKNYKPHPIGYGMGRYHRIDAEMRRRMGGRNK